MENVGQSSSTPASFIHANLLVNPHFPSSPSSWLPKRESAHSTTMSQPKDSSSPHEDSMPSTSDFVKKLYKMLEDPAFQSVVSWGPQGDCFVVKDMNEFTKAILPRMFKHSNFASFVRQLNKYDFHKVKNTDDNQFGEHSWTFRHPDFHADRRDALENIKRKVPAQRKAAQAAAVAAQAQAQAAAVALSSLPSISSSLLPNSSPALQAQNQLQIDQLQHEIRRLKEEGDDLRGRLRNLERNYENVLIEMVGFQRGMAQQDGLMQSLISYFLGNDSGKLKATNTSSLLNPQSTPSASIVPTASIAFIQQQQQSRPSITQVSQAQSKTQTQVQTSSTSSSTTSPPSSSLLSSTSQSRNPGDSSLFLSLNRFLNNNHATVNAVPPTGGTGTNANASGSGSGSGQTVTGTGYKAGDNDIVGDVDVGRMSGLMGISEINRRVNGWNGTGGGGGGWNGDGQQAQLVNTQGSSVGTGTGGGGMIPGGMTRAEAIGKIEEIYRSHLASGSTTTGGPSTSGSQQWGRQDGTIQEYAASDSCRNQPRLQQSSTSQWGLNLDDEDPSKGLQVYTVGQLMPRNGTDGMGHSWNFEAGYGVASSTSGTNRGFVDKEGEEGSGDDEDDDEEGEGEEEEEEERVMPSPMNDTFASSSSSTTIAPSSTSNNDTNSSKNKNNNTSTSSISTVKRNKIRLRRSTFVPSWAIPPRVLIVDDDVVSRKLGSKFLQVYGCSFDVAVDGVSAVNKMNLGKYDLVLMDIVMPKLDGVSATSLIRQFDHMTPIISMTSNSKPNEIMTYYSSGMNDILPKPFTQNGLFEILEKHLMHLKAIQRMNTVVPRSIGVPPLEDSRFEQAVNSGAAALALPPPPPQPSSSSASVSNHLTTSPSATASSSSSNQTNDISSPTSTTTTTTGVPYHSTSSLGASYNSYSDNESRVNNPLSGMGLTDEQYNMMLQNIVNGDGFMNGMVDGGGGGGGISSSSSSMGMMGVGEKRGYDEAGLSSSSGREKRGRFEVVD